MFRRINGGKKEIICTKVVIRNNIFSRGTGLMFHRRIFDEAHIFTFAGQKKVPLTMWFVFFPIDVLYLDSKKIIVEMKNNFKPFTNYTPQNNAAYVIEVPAGTIREKKLKIGNKLDF
jgi:uncharacterized protein